MDVTGHISINFNRAAAVKNLDIVLRIYKKLKLKPSYNVTATN